MMELASVIKVLQEVLIDKPLKVSGFCLDKPEERIKVFMVLLNEVIKEASKDEL